MVVKRKRFKKPIKHMCQFSWYCDGKSDEIKDHYTYNQLYVLAEGLVASNFKTLLDITDDRCIITLTMLNQNGQDILKKLLK